VLEQQQGEWKAIAGSVFGDMMEVFQFLELVLYYSKTGNSLCRLCAAVDAGDVSVVLDAGR